MNRALCLLVFLMLASCGYSQVNNELIGQPKSIESTTPLICPNQNILHLSLGVMRHGVGSMSTEDVLISIPDDNLALRLQPVVKAGKLINAQTNEARFRWCNEMQELVAFEIVEDAPAAPPKE